MAIFSTLAPDVQANIGGSAKRAAGSFATGGRVQALQSLESLGRYTSTRQTGGPQYGLPGGATTSDPSLALQGEQFRQADARRQQLLNLLGLTPQTVGQGGLLGGTFFQSILGNPVGQVAGDITGGVAGAAPGLFQPGGPDAGGVGAGGAMPGAVPGTDAATGQIMQLLSGFGASERQRIGQQQTDLLNTNLARLESRGLGGSNLATNVAEQAARFGSEQNLALSDRLIGQQVGALTGGAERGLQARGQNLNLLSNLLNPILNIG